MYLEADSRGGRCEIRLQIRAGARAPDLISQVRILVFGLKAVGSCWRVSHWRVIWTDLHSKDHFGCCVDGPCQMLNQDWKGWGIPVCSTSPLSETLSHTHGQASSSPGPIPPGWAPATYTWLPQSFFPVTGSPIISHYLINHSFSLSVSWYMGWIVVPN